MDGGEVRRAEAHGMKRLKRTKENERRIDGHDAPAQCRRETGKHEKPRRADSGDDAGRDRKESDLGDHADGPQRPDHAIGNPLPAPMQRAEAVIEGVARLDQARGEEKQEKERRVNQPERVGEFEAAEL